MNAGVINNVRPGRPVKCTKLKCSISKEVSLMSERNIYTIHMVINQALAYMENISPHEWDTASATAIVIQSKLYSQGRKEIFSS